MTDPTPPVTCALCGKPAIGMGVVTSSKYPYALLRLCHEPRRDCYTRWTRDGVRPVGHG